MQQESRPCMLSGMRGGSSFANNKVEEKEEYSQRLAVVSHAAAGDCQPVHFCIYAYVRGSDCIQGLFCQAGHLGQRMGGA